MPVGDIVALWRYPVKSMQGEEVAQSLVTERGLLGDRAYAVLERETGFVASAKHSRKWSRLLQCRAAFAEPPQMGVPPSPIRITLPDGDVISSTQPDVDLMLSRALDREVSLITEVAETPIREANRAPLDGPVSEVIRQEKMGRASPKGTFFDYAPVHVLTTATINLLRELYSPGCFDLRRFRPNIVVAPPASTRGFVEDQWLGKSLQIGAVNLQIIDPCPRCLIPTLAQSDLPRDVGILRTIAQHHSAASISMAPGVVLSAVAGVYASIRSGGDIRRGEAVWLKPTSA